ncbi:DUF6626 family protein [Aliihoeflea sp. 2WW]|uniref:DUF6626 family protein n=1 Tax=Aliihoeflea sp. 2WW TaxID=1381123 RepID=UPI0012681636|nr:DUF6626 family protein [Aliihoeflea sp. 2WW]
MDIRTIYETLNKLGYANSQVEFSRFWLGRSARYYSHLIAAGREPGLGTLVALEWRLMTLLDGQPRICGLLEDLRNHISSRSITDQPTHGKRCHLN